MSRPADLYRMFDGDDQLLYVGISAALGERISQHRNEKPWWSTVAYIRVEHYETREEAREQELLAIRTELPLYNIEGVVEIVALDLGFCVLRVAKPRFDRWLHAAARSGLSLKDWLREVLNEAAAAQLTDA